MKIWYLTSEFPPTFGGGIGMYVNIVSQLMAADGNEVSVFIHDSKNREEIVSEKMKYIRFERTEKAEYKALGYWASLAYQYYKVVCDYIDREGSPDIIEVQEYNAIGYYILQYKYLGDSHLQNIKIVVHMHTPTFELCRVNRTPEYRFPEYWIGQMEKFCIKAADGLVTQSEFLKNCLLPYADKEIRVIPLPYDFNYKNEINYECGEYLLYAGRTEWRKGIVQFIAEMDKLWRNGCKTKLVALGGDTYFAPKACFLGDMLRKKYAQRIEEGLLQFWDSVPPEELPRLMAKARAIVVPSIYENYPYINIIAMSLGMPVLVSKQGGQAEMVAENGINGFIFDWEVQDDCVEKVQKLLALSDSELRKMGQYAQKRILSLCNLEKNLQERTAFYTSILTNTDSSRDYPFLVSIEKTPIPTHISSGRKGMLSIVIPYYNLPETIEETIQSLLKITYDNYEIILVNDGSNDKINISKLEELKYKYPVIEIIEIPNGGLANARNVGAARARGEFLAFLDADDLVCSSYYERCITILEKYSNVSFVYSWLQYFERDNSVWTTFDTTIPQMLLANMLAAFAVVRKKDFLAFGLNRIDMEYGMEDYDSWLGMVENGRLGVCIPEALCLYRIRPNSMARSMNRDSRIYSYKILENGHRELYHCYTDEIYNLLIANGSSMLWGSPTQQHYPSGPLDIEQLSRELQKAQEKVQEMSVTITKFRNSRWYKVQQKYFKFVHETVLGRFFRFKMAAPLHWIRKLVKS